MATTSSLVDLFDSQDATKFTYASGHTAAGGTLNLAATTLYPETLSVGSFDFTGSTVMVESVARLQGGFSAQTIFGLRIDASNGYYFNFEGSTDGVSGNLKLLYRSGGTSTEQSVSYDPTAMRVWRLVHDGASTVSFQTSPDRVTWTTRGATVAALAGSTSTRISFSAGYYNSADVVTGPAKFDNLNYAPAIKYVQARLGGALVAARDRYRSGGVLEP